MAIIVQKRPYEYCFSGNPVAYELYSDLAAADASVCFEIKLLFKLVNGEYSSTEAIPWYPVNGVAAINVQDLLEGLLTYEVPVISNDEKAVQMVAGHSGKFYLQFRETTPLNADVTWDDSESEFERTVIKGGISRFKYEGSNFFSNYFFLNKPFLTWQQRGRLAAPAERMYLTYLHTADSETLSAVCSVYYTDGSFAIVQTDFAVIEKGACYYVPAGAMQWGLPDKEPAKKIYYWEITIIGNILAGATALSEAFRYYADNRNDYNNCTLHYRNSIGGLDSLRVRGAIEQAQDYSFTEQVQTVASDYSSAHYFAPQKLLTNSRETIAWKGDIGHLGKEEQDRLRDSHLQRECWQEVEGKWWPINITTKSRKQKTTNDTRFTFPIEWSLAYEGDSYYTPQYVSLGNSNGSNVCMALITDVKVLLYDTPDGKVRATVQLVENDPEGASSTFRYQVVGGSLPSGWITAAYGSFEVIVAKEELLSLELQPICTGNIYGRKTIVPIDTRTGQSGGGTGGGTPAGNCRIVNNTGTSTGFTITIDSVVVADGVVGAWGNTAFEVAPDYYRRVEVFLADLSPASITLYVTAPPQEPDYFSGGSAKFYDVTFSTDFSIIIS